MKQDKEFLKAYHEEAEYYQVKNEEELNWILEKLELPIHISGVNWNAKGLLYLRVFEEEVDVHEYVASPRIFNPIAKIYRVSDLMEDEVEFKSEKYHDAIEPSHYQNNGKYIDKIDEWYYKHDIQTFRNIMRAMIDRYLYRYENKNGIEDLNKAMRFIERLKEYEEMELEE